MSKAIISLWVPQASLLGLLLFFLHVNDIHQCPTKLELYLFAYDNNMHYADKNFKPPETVANGELPRQTLRLVKVNI